MAPPLSFLVRPARFERAAYGFEVRRSIQLSYGRLKDGVSDGIWTHDRRGHNPVLYQLSYTHHNRILDFGFWIADYGFLSNKLYDFKRKNQVLTQFSFSYNDSMFIFLNFQPVLNNRDYLN